MSDDFEDLLKRWLRDRGATDRSTLEFVAGNVATLPPRRRRQPSQLAAAAAVIVALGLAAFALAPRFSAGAGEASPGTGEASPVPPDPAAFADDPRLARCGATVETAIDAFEMIRARDYRLHLPAMLLAPELDVDAPAFVVVYRGMSPIPRLGGAPPPGQTWQPRSLEPGRHDVCVLVGTDAATAEMSVYSDVDTTGLTVDVAPTYPSATPPTPEVAAPSLTPEPAPYWAGDYVAAALQCDGPPADFGSEGITEAAVGGRDPSLALGRYLAEVKALGLVFPTEGFAEVEVLDSWALFGYVVGGRTRAAVAIQRLTPGADGPWFAAAVASCDPSEFDPATPLGTTITIWTDASGAAIPTTVVREQADCYNATQLEVNGRLFVWDPGDGAYDPTMLEGTFETSPNLPATARDSGYRNAKRALFLAPDGSAAFVRNGKIVERWPHVKGDEVSRTDCN
jgi:hypothetical protein